MRGVKGSGPWAGRKPRKPKMGTNTPAHLLGAIAPMQLDETIPGDTRDLATRARRRAEALLGEIDSIENVGDRMALMRTAIAAVGQAASVEGLATNIDERKVLRSPAWRRIEDEVRECTNELCGPCARKLAELFLRLGS